MRNAPGDSVCGESDFETVGLVELPVEAAFARQRFEPRTRRRVGEPMAVERLMQLGGVVALLCFRRGYETERPVILFVGLQPDARDKPVALELLQHGDIAREGNGRSVWRGAPDVDAIVADAAAVADFPADTLRVPRRRAVGAGGVAGEIVAERLRRAIGGQRRRG